MKNKQVIFAAIALLFASIDTVNAEILTWNIGNTPDTNSVIATLNTDNNTLTVSGNGEMKNFDTYSSSVRAPWYGKDIRRVIIEDGVKSIGNNAFRGCSGLVLLEQLPNSLLKIGEYAFYGCKWIENIIIPRSVTAIGFFAFNECEGLKSIEVDPANMRYTSIGGLLYTKAKDTLIICPQEKKNMSKSMLDSVIVIGDYAFYNCSGLAGALIIPNSVTIIGAHAFDGSGLYGAIIIPNSVITIGDYAFANCATVGVSGNQERLRLAVISNSVTTIGDYAFEKSSISDFYISWTTPPNISQQTFANTNSVTSKFHILAGTKTQYLIADVWRDMSSKLQEDHRIEWEIETMSGKSHFNSYDLRFTIEAEPIEGAGSYRLGYYPVRFYNSEIKVLPFSGSVQSVPTFSFDTYWDSDRGADEGVTYIYELCAYKNKTDSYYEGEILARKVDTFTLIFNTSDSASAIEEFSQADNGLQVFPNPTSNEITISPTLKGGNIYIYNTVGLRIASYRATAKQTVINIQNFPTGIYFVKIGGKTVKVVKK